MLVLWSEPALWVSVTGAHLRPFLGAGYPSSGAGGDMVVRQARSGGLLQVLDQREDRPGLVLSLGGQQDVHVEPVAVQGAAISVGPLTLP